MKIKDENRKANQTSQQISTWQSKGCATKKKKNRGGEGSEIMNKGAENCCNNEGLTS